MEALSRMIFATVDGDFLSGFSVWSVVVNISHLLFADDTLVCYGASFDDLRYLHALFLCFKVVFGLKINLAKSKLVPMGNAENVVGLVGILGCGGSWPMKCLGSPVGGLLQGQVHLGKCYEKIEQLPTSQKKDVLV
jgi:hypothetical protein